ncbi:DNA polymerase epsilon subunit B [Gloeopeniophorella convolvens]|nr:DNA polymerase epsilon subunit B [Gloeopeniophorella convolvens]
MPISRQQIIIRVFRKYSHSLGPDELEFLEDVLEEHEISDEDVEMSIGLIAKEYNKQDDASMKVSLQILKRVYQALQGAGDQRSQKEDAYLDPEDHLHFIDAFDMPLWHWSPERGSFEKAAHRLTVTGTAESRILAIRDRLNIIKQTILRNEHFTPATIPNRDREHLLTLKSTKQLLGRAGERFLLFGMLIHSKEGKLCLEDLDGVVELDFSQLDQPSEGLFTEGSFALVEGDYTENATFSVIAVGHPPCESRETARSIFGHIDFLGKGATTPLEDTQHAVRIQRDFPNMNFFFFSDVWLDHPDTLKGLQKIFDNCIENNFIPKVIVLCGNFTSAGIAQGNSRDVQKYQDGFDALADLIAAYPLITQRTHFVLVPGPLDLAANALLPRRPLLAALTTRLRAKVPRLHLASNPCRLRFFGQELVVFREDTMARMLRNLVGVKPAARNEDLKRYLVQSILDQSHLSPFTTHIQPVLAEHDHTMRLYPLPTCVVLADKYDSYRMTYEGCHVFNPGRFVGRSLGFSTYTPATRESEACVVDLEAEN